MKTRSIVLPKSAAELVRAILDGKKTQTRLPIMSNHDLRKPEFSFEGIQRLGDPTNGYTTSAVFRWHGDAPNSEVVLEKSTYQVGDVLRVKEPFFFGYPYVDDEPQRDQEQYWYYADTRDAQPGDCSDEWCINEFGHDKSLWPSWKPANQLPEEGSRIWLKITAVTAQRVQDIDELDAALEGYTLESYLKNHEAIVGYPAGQWVAMREEFTGEENNTIEGCPVSWFAWQWGERQGKDSWEYNDWVFVYTFERIEKPTTHDRL